jgi:pimeloyl-ACP methyl ester carboxylesterase
MPTEDHAHICRPDIVGSLHRSGTWLLLRGLTREAGHWGDFPQQLQAALPEARILAIDLPGNGTLHRQASPSTIPAMVAACRAELATRRGRARACGGHVPRRDGGRRLGGRPPG